MIKRIEEACNHFRPDVMFVDCLYNIGQGAELGKAPALYPITSALEEMKVKYDLTLPVVHHLLKGNHELGLQDDRMAGSSELGR